MAHLWERCSRNALKVIEQFKLGHRCRRVIDD